LAIAATYSQRSRVPLKLTRLNNVDTSDLYIPYSSAENSESNRSFILFQIGTSSRPICAW
jgi:hypothetical protein